jgi:hydroxyacylglutathione hydrolase
MYVPCHTKGHIAFVVYPPPTGSHEQDRESDTAPLLFCGDTLFIGGCGRFFEGTAEDMLRNMDRLATLPPATQVFCAHEYTEANLKFLHAVEAGGGGVMDHTSSAADTEQCPARFPAAEKLLQVQWARQAGRPTVPGTIGEELSYNLFMRCREPSTQRLVGANDAVEAMRLLRERKNNFKG